VARRTPGHPPRAQRQLGCTRGLRATTWSVQDESTAHGLGLHRGPARVLRRTDTAIPRGAKHQLNARWPLGGQPVREGGLPAPAADNERLRTTMAGFAARLQAPEPLVTFFLRDRPLLAPGACAPLVGIPCPDLLRQQPHGPTRRRERQGTMDKQASARR